MGRGVDEESNSKWHRKEGVQSKKWCPSEKFVYILFSVTQSLFLLGFSQSSDNITASNKNSTSKKKPTSISEIRAVGKGGQRGRQPSPHHFLEQSFFSHVKSEHIKFLHVKNMKLEFIYWTRVKWQKVDSSFSFCHFSSKLSYHSYQQRVCKIMFPIRTFVKTNSNLMCGSFLLCQVIARTTDTKTKSKIISR